MLSVRVVASLLVETREVIKKNAIVNCFQDVLLRLTVLLAEARQILDRI